MPAISIFYGITIKIYFMSKEHKPLHIYVIYGEFTATIDINNYKVLDGDLPQKALNLVIEWMKLHKDELLDIWESQELKKLIH